MLVTGRDIVNYTRNSEIVSNYGSVHDYANLPHVQYIKEL